jgi:hypothetical protein
MPFVSSRPSAQRVVRGMQVSTHLEAAMLEESNQSEFTEFVRAHHVHFDVKPEILIQGAERVKVGFEVRIWGMHTRGSQCHDLAARLSRLADWAIPHEHRPTVIVIEPFERALYDSKEIAGADEIAVAIRLVHRDGYELPIDACEERCLKEIRERLRTLKAQER